MSKLRPLVAFEITTTIKYLTIFYCIEFSMVAVTLLLTWLGRGSLDHPYFACMESCAMIFIFIFGIFGFAEDFKMLLQNGFTRCYIFIATLALFLQTAATLALVDTLAARFLEGVGARLLVAFHGNLWAEPYALAAGALALWGVPGAGLCWLLLCADGDAAGDKTCADPWDRALVCRRGDIADGFS